MTLTQTKTKNNSSYIGMAIVGIIMILFLVYPKYSIDKIATFTQFCIQNLGLEIIWFASIMVILAVLIAVLPIGKVKLGGKDASTEFSFFSWLAMLFTCGMGSGLIFWGIAEPIFHFSNMPQFAAAKSQSADMALGLTYFHWGVHAWSIYALSALAIAWFGFNRSRSFHISSSFTAKKNSAFRLLDWLAILAIIFGIAGTFANTIALIQTGVQETISSNIGSVGFRYGIILFLAVLFTTSSILGVNRGIKWLSQFNTLLMLLFVVVVIALFSPFDVFKRVYTSTLSYLSILPDVSFSIKEESKQWSIGWSVIYMVWWIAWTPFVAPFIARISKGRTIREFLLCVVLVPTFASIIWFSAFGGEALSQSFIQDIITAVNQDYTKGLFVFFSHLSFGKILSLTAIILLITFIITSADSALLVCGILSDNESTNAKIMWSILLVSLSMALIYINDVDLNKQVAIAGALPFIFVQLAQVVMMLRDMKNYK